MTATNEEQFIFELAGRKIPVYEFNVEESISENTQISITLATPDALSPDDSVGKQGVLTIKGKKDRYFHGLIREFEQVDSEGQYQMYSLSLVPLFWLLTLTRDVRIFQNLSTPDIIKKVLKDSDLTTNLYQFSLTGAYEPREYCVQYRETDYEFITRLLAEEGIFFYFTHKKGEHKLVFADGSPDYKPIEGTSTVQFNSRGALVEKQEEYVTEISKSRSIRSGKVTLADYDFKKPNFKLRTEKSGKKDTRLELYDYPGNFTQMGRGKQLTNVKLGEAEKYRDTINGSSLVAGFAPGFKFTLKDHPTDSFNKEYLLTSVSHRGTQPQVLQEIAPEDEGTSYGNNYVCIPPDVDFRPEYHFKKPSVEGVQTAVVTGPEGEEIYTDEHGRIKVQFHWDREGRNDEKTSCWMRVSQNWAGAGWGGMFIPRIGQEVIVDFIDGDPDRPLVTGCIYNGVNKPPYPLPDDKTKSTIKTESTPGGGGYNEIRFEDKKGEEEVYIQAEKDQNELVKNNMSTIIKNDRILTVQKNRTTAIKEGTDSLSVEKGPRTIKVKGGENHQNSADFNHKISGNYNLTVGGNISIKASGIVTVNGQAIKLNG